MIKLRQSHGKTKIGEYKLGDKGKDRSSDPVIQYPTSQEFPKLKILNKRDEMRRGIQEGPLSVPTQ